jgi:hypothetical protein
LGWPALPHFLQRLGCGCKGSAAKLSYYSLLFMHSAGMAELADAADSKFHRTNPLSQYLAVNNNLIDMLSRWE